MLLCSYVLCTYVECQKDLIFDVYNVKYLITYHLYSDLYTYICVYTNLAMYVHMYVCTHVFCMYSIYVW